MDCQLMGKSSTLPISGYRFKERYVEGKNHAGTSPPLYERGGIGREFAKPNVTGRDAGTTLRVVW
jgi:hypothetical protein